jgi:HEAT repeat protein
MKLALILIAPLMFAQPRVQNARLENRPVAGSLDATFKGIVNAQASPAWIGYSVPQIAGERNMGSTCVLEGNHDGNVTIVESGGTVHLEGAPEFFVLFRVENKQVEKVRNVSMDCNIDAGGLSFFWITGVNPSQSIALLESLTTSTERRVVNGAIGAIGLHRDPASDAALDRLTAASQPEDTRRQAAFWLGNSRGRHGYESLLRILRDDPSDRVREHAVFALTQSKEADAIPAIVRVAHDDKSVRVRGQALFWLAQKASRQISEDTIRKAIDQDPETEVKKKAVFALTQLRNGDGVPLLIEIARTNRNAAVKKQAMFWLGQSKDPRALKFFEDVLATR